MTKKKSVLALRWEARNTTPRIRLSIHGSRSLSDERVKILIMAEIKKQGLDNQRIVEIVTHGEPDGVCAVARKLCRESAIPLKLHFLNFDKLAGAFYHRSIAVLYDSDIALFIHDGVNKGCWNECLLAQKIGIPYEYHKLEPAEHSTSVGFDIKTNWDVLFDDKDNTK